MTKPSAYVLFCDDVRQEIGDKRTFVGVYGTQLQVPQLPMLIPKFYAVTTLICTHGKMPKSLTVRLTFRGVEIGKTDFTEAELSEWAKMSEEELRGEEAEFPKDDPPKLRVYIEVMISPFVVEVEGRMCSHVDTDAGTIRAGSIMIVQRDGAESTALPFGDPDEQPDGVTLKRKQQRSKLIAK